VIVSDNPLLAQLRPRIAKRDADPWVRAYALVFEYLAEHGFNVTIDTTTIENGSPLAPGGDASSTSDQQLSAAIEAAPPKRTVGQILAPPAKATPKRPPSLVLPDIEPPKERSPSPRSVLDYDALKIVPSAARTSPVASPPKEEKKPEPPKRKAVARKGAKAVRTKTRPGTTPPRKDGKANVLFISSPGNTQPDMPSDSDLQSDFVIEEIQPRAAKH
jgi:hypothetical protein